MQQAFKQQVIEDYYHPMLTHEGLKDAFAWKKLRALPKEKKDILISSELPEKMRELQVRLHLDVPVIGEISFFIRELFFGSMSIDDIKKKLAQILVSSQHDPSEASEIAAFIEKEIVSLKPAPDEDDILEAEEAKKLAASRDKLPIVSALGKYPRLGEQLITSGRLSIKNRQDPARGSLSNWLRVYRDELGVGYHDPVMRARFLFNSPNTKDVTSEERERLNVILRSVEESAPVEIDTVRFEIIFPPFRVTERKPPASLPLQSAQSVPKPVSNASTPLPPSTKSANPSPISPNVRPSAPITPAPAPKRQGFTTFSGTGEHPSSVGVRAQRGINFSGFPGKPAVQNVPKPVLAQKAQAKMVPPASSEDMTLPKKSSGSFSFTSKHAFPSEREGRGEKGISMKPAQVLPSAVPNPFVIRPVSRKKEELGGSLPKNVVDLREE